MINFDAAIAILRDETRALGIETTRLAKAGRRVLAEPVHARIDAPRYDAAAMDGFAVASGDLRLESYAVAGASYPGQPWIGRIGEGQAIRIMTGASLPDGSDRVVPFELAEERDGSVCFPGGWPAKLHVRSRSSDIRAEQIVLPPGTMLDPRTLVVAGAADVDVVRTWKRPIVSVLASGDELAAPGSAHGREGAIPDSLSEAILLMARQYDAKPGDAALVRDESAAIRAAAERLLGDCDVLVLVGGASRGDRDFAKIGLEPLGLDVRFAKVAIRPGKPVWYGRIGERRVLGLPGNPTAAMTVARLFLVPLLRALGGRDLDGALRWSQARLSAPCEAGGERESFLCGALTDDGVEVLGRQSASAQLMLARADVLVRISPGSPARGLGETVDVLKF